ncbi:MAG TPA: DUF2341 domain-containing protein, partial [Bacteroidia bacterium]|nr:DUF2341 domain-containing protein [Bacteroidia bacterium]
MIGWGYKDAIQVQNPGPLKLNHQVLLTLNTQALISLGRLQATGADLRFSKDCNGLSQYSYYIESGINTTATKIWVLTDSLAANSNRVITMFYGNSTAPAGSSFDNTFPPSSRLIVSAGTITLNGTNNFSWFEIALGATVLVGPNSPFVINARRIIIAGILDGNGSGHLGGASISNGSGPGGGFASTGNAGTFGAGGASYAGIGGPGGYPPPASNAPLTGQPGLTYENASTDSINMGSGGGGSTVVGGAGGGGITLTGDFVNITGTIRANGAAGTNS